jgi:hypothetical protein
MPNPIAHPAVSVPFTKVGLVLSALVVGSISPDFGYFVKLPADYFMYTVPGLILFDLPAGLIALWIFHALLKWPLLSLLPDKLQRRLFQPAQGFTFGPPKRFILIVLSLVVGSITHVVWDSFTHDYGWAVIQFSFLQTAIGGIPLYTILQNAGSFIGIGLLTYWFLRWLPTGSQSEQILPRFSIRFQMILFVLAIVSFTAMEGSLIYLRLMNNSHLTFTFFLIISSIFSAALIISLFAGLYCLAWMLTYHKSIPPAYIHH